MPLFSFSPGMIHPAYFFLEIDHVRFQRSCFLCHGMNEESKAPQKKGQREKRARDQNFLGDIFGPTLM